MQEYHQTTHVLRARQPGQEEEVFCATGYRTAYVTAYVRTEEYFNVFMTLQTRWQSTQPKTFYQRTPHRMQHKGNVNWRGRATRNIRVTLSKHKSRDSSFKTLGNKSMNRPPKLEVWKQEDGGSGEKASVLFGTMITCHLSWAYTRSYHHQRTLDQDRDGKVSGVESSKEGE